MAKFVSVAHAKYEGSVNTLKAQLTDANGKEIDFEIDGLAFAELMGLANITNAVFHHHQAGRELPLMTVTGIQTGVASHGDPKQFGMVLSLLVPQTGILHFLLPAEVEMALRAKLQTPRVS